MIGMFGIGMWELLMIAICGVVVVGIPTVAIVLALGSGGRGRGPDDPR